MKCVVGGAEERAVVGDELAAALGLEVVDEDAAQRRRHGNRDGHSQDAAEGVAHDEADEGERGVDLDRRLHDEGRDYVVGQVLDDKGGNEGLEREHGAHEEGQQRGDGEGQPRADDGDEVQQQRHDRHEAGVGMANEGERNEREGPTGQRSDDDAAHVAAHRTAHDGQQDRQVATPLRAGDGHELAHYDGIVLGEPVGDDDPQRERDKAADERRRAGHDAVRERLGKLGRGPQADVGKGPDCLVDEVLDLGGAEVAQARPKLVDGVARLRDVSRHQLQHLDELRDEGRHQEHDHGGGHQEHDEKGDEGRDPAAHSPVVEPVGDGAADEAEQHADEKELNGRPYEPEGQDDEHEHGGDADEGPAAHGQVLGLLRALGAVALLVHAPTFP